MKKYVDLTTDHSVRSTYSSIEYSKIEVNWADVENKSYFMNFTASIGLENAGTPLVIFNKTGCIKAIEGEAITSESMDCRQLCSVKAAFTGQDSLASRTRAGWHGSSLQL